MGKIGVVIKVMPESPETDLEAVKEAVRDKVEVSDMQEEPVAFGLKAVMVSTVVDDGEGGTDKVEESLSGIKGVQSVQVEDVQKL